MGISVFGRHPVRRRAARRRDEMIFFKGEWRWLPITKEILYISAVGSISGCGSPGHINVFTFAMMGRGGTEGVGEHNCVAFLNTTGSSASSRNYYYPISTTDHVPPSRIGGWWRNNYPNWRYASDTWDLLEYNYYRCNPDVRADDYQSRFGSFVKQLHWNKCREWGLLR